MNNVADFDSTSNSFGWKWLGYLLGTNSQTLFVVSVAVPLLQQFGKCYLRNKSAKNFLPNK